MVVVIIKASLQNGLFSDHHLTTTSINTHSPMFPTQQIYTCSKSTTKILEKDVKYVQS